MRKITHGRFAATVAAVGAIPGIQQASNIVFNIAGLTTETIQVTGVYRTHSGTKVASAGLRPIALATGAVEASDSLLTNGDFQLLDLNFEELIFTKSATTDPAVINYRIYEEE